MWFSVLRTGAILALCPGLHAQHCSSIDVSREWSRCLQTEVELTWGDSICLHFSADLKMSALPQKYYSTSTWLTKLQMWASRQFIHLRNWNSRLRPSAAWGSRLFEEPICWRSWAEPYCRRLPVDTHTVQAGQQASVNGLIGNVFILQDIGPCSHPLTLHHSKKAVVTAGQLLGRLCSKSFFTKQMSVIISQH